MPIYDQGYRRYEARGALRQVRFWPITREALRLILSKRAFLGLLAVSFLPFVVRVIQVYIVTRFPEAGRVLPVDGRLFGQFLNMQIGFTILLCIFGASGLIANDLGHRFLKGQLDDDFTIHIEQDRMDMSNALALADVNAEEIAGKEGPPLATAIALLEDRDGNIKLEVPVKGDLNDPNFNVLGALNPIITKAVAISRKPRSLIRLWSRNSLFWAWVFMVVTRLITACNGVLLIQRPDSVGYLAFRQEINAGSRAL